MKKFFLIAILFFIISCSPVSSSWSCKNKTKGSCKNIFEIDNNIDNNQNKNKNIISKENFNKTKDSKETKESQSLNDFRSEERVFRVLFSSYTDPAENRHDESFVYFLMEKSTWRK